MNQENHLIKFLQDISKPKKEKDIEGFEELIAYLLTELTGNRFVTAKSGYQAGRDISSRDGDGNCIDVECKCYKQKYRLDENELMGKLTQALVDNPSLDLFVVVTSTSTKLDSQLEGNLYQAGKKFGVEILFIEAGDGNPSSLEALCAYGEEKFINFLCNNYPDVYKNEINKLRIQLSDIKENPKYENKVSSLKKALSASHIGYDNWMKKQSEWLLEQFSSEEKSRHSFGQVIKVNEIGDEFIERKEALQKLDAWLNSWKENDENKKPFVLTGEEGDGKTWTSASWIVNYIKKNKQAPVIFLPSKKVASTDIEEILSEAIAGQLREFDSVFWKKKIGNWLKRFTTSEPIVILIIDGINENFDFNWKEVLHQLQIEPWSKRIALLLTGRTIYWDERFSHWDYLKVEHWLLSSYNDDEFNVALSRHKLNIRDIPENLAKLMRKPRYFALTIKHREKMIYSGDVTIQRLIYEDFRDREKGIKNESLSNVEFDALLRGLARKVECSENLFDQKVFLDLLPLIKGKEQTFEDLKTHGILDRDKVDKDKFKIKREILAHGLGLLLHSKLIKLASNDINAIEECRAGNLEPQPEMDFKTEIVEAAVFLAMTDKNTPENVRLCLLKYWINSLNFNSSHLESFPAYFPCSPETYFNLAEILYSKEMHNHTVEDWVAYTFLKWTKESKFFEMLKLRLEEWMGYVSIFGDIHMKTRSSEDKAEKNKEKIKKQLGVEFNSGRVEFWEFQLTLVDNYNLLRLSKLALSIISQLDRRPFIRAIITLVLAEIIMMDWWNNNSIQWILRTNKEEMWGELEPEVMNLMSKIDNTNTAQKTADQILSYVGSPEANRLRKQLPFKQNPSNSSWTKEDYYKCLEREDMDVFLKCKKMNNLILYPDLPLPESFRKEVISIMKDINPSTIWKPGINTIEQHNFENFLVPLCAISPKSAEEIIKRVIQDARDRDTSTMSMLACENEKHYIIFGPTEMSIIKTLWQSILKKWGDREKGAESYLFTLLLIDSSAKDQMRFLLDRNETAECLKKFELFFKKLDTEAWGEVLDKLRKSNVSQLRSILWFISTYPRDIPKMVLREISQFLFHSDKLIRLNAVKIAYCSGDTNLIDDFIRSGWIYKDENVNTRAENCWGSKIISEYGTHLSYEEVSERIIPSQLAMAIEFRGLKDEEIAKYVDKLNNILETDNPSNRDFIIPWLQGHFDNRLVKEIIKRNPSVIHRWIDGIKPDTDAIDWKITYRFSFYIGICNALLEIHPELGAELYHRMKKVKNITGYRVPINDLFKAKEQPEIVKLWDEIIDNCYLDISVLEMAIVNQSAKNSDWFKRKINQYLASDLLFEKARGINMLGFLDEEDSLEKLTKLQEEMPECWVTPVIQTAVERWTHNCWAKTYFQRFLEDENNINAWAAFRLFLECVDSRFNIWGNDLIEKFKDASFFKDREIYFEINRETVNKSIGKNEKTFEDNFLGIAIENNKIWPWK